MDNTVPGTPEVKDVEFDMPLAKSMNGTSHAAQIQKIVNNIKSNGRTVEFKEPQSKLHTKKNLKKPPNLIVHTRNTEVRLSFVYFMLVGCVDNNINKILIALFFSII